MDISSLFDLSVTDPAMLVMRAALASTVAAAVVLAVVGRLLRQSGLGWTLAVAAGFAAAVAATGPRLDFVTADGRILLALAPAVLAIELLGLAVGRWAWIARIALALAVVPIVDHGTAFTIETVVLLGEATLAGWAALAFLQDRTKGRGLPIALAIACAGSGMLIAYLTWPTGGLFALALGGALMGAAVASLLLFENDARGAVGIAWLLFAATVIATHHFATLSATYAILLLASPMLCWAAELLPTKVWIRGILGIMLTAGQVGYVASLALAPPPSAPPPDAAPVEDQADWYK